MDIPGIIKALKPSNLDKGANTQSAPSVNIVDNNKTLTAPGCPMGTDMGSMGVPGMGNPSMGTPGMMMTGMSAPMQQMPM